MKTLIEQLSEDSFFDHIEPEDKYEFVSIAHAVKVAKQYAEQTKKDCVDDFRKELIRVAFELEKESKRYPKMNTADVVMMFRRLAN